MRRMDNTKLGDRVRLRRQHLSLSQLDLGKAIGISQVAIRKVEAGGNTRHGRHLAEALNTTLLWLETGNDPVVDSNGNIIQGGAAVTLSQSKAEHDGWPFRRVDRDRFLALTPAQLHRAETAIDDLLRGYEAENLGIAKASIKR